MEDPKSEDQQAVIEQNKENLEEVKSVASYSKSKLKRMKKKDKNKAQKSLIPSDLSKFPKSDEKETATEQIEEPVEGLESVTSYTKSKMKRIQKKMKKEIVNRPSEYASHFSHLRKILVESGVFIVHKVNLNIIVHYLEERIQILEHLYGYAPADALPDIPNDPCNEKLLLNLFEQVYGNPLEFPPSLFALIRQNIQFIRTSLNEYVLSIAKDRTKVGKEAAQSVPSFPISVAKTT
ncbi:hypothetical protein PMAYCL1PPCAC_19550 [Pristionchus mayeri]|uniref:Uncharacterized protein n=1 Tax=Pristionchus mayeri TaxID=1317129 RepID=A0AAN5CRQ0_9BILA|nr:hypothetical protein PMAYCL1PPCAC_19550 [Pristionchus mayeri]